MSPSSTQLTAFALLVAAVLAVAVLVNRQDLDTSVNTLSDTLLPNVYDSSAQEDIQGFSIRYPLGWQVSEPQPLTVQLSRPVDENNRAGDQYNVILSFIETTTEDPNPLAFVGEGASLLALDELALPAAEIITESAEGGVTFLQGVRLSESVGLTVQNDPATPILAEDWPEIREQLTLMLNSIQLSEDFGLVPDAFTVELPEGWARVNENKLIYAAQTPADPNVEPIAVLQFGVLPDAQINGILAERVAALFPETDVTQITDPMEMMNVFASYEGDEALSISVSTPLSEVSYMGFEGLEYGLETESGISNWLVLTADDGNHILVNKFVVDKAQAETLFGQMDEILNATEYRTPAQALLDALAEGQ